MASFHGECWDDETGAARQYRQDPEGRKEDPLAGCLPQPEFVTAMPPPEVDR